MLLPCNAPSARAATAEAVLQNIEMMPAFPGAEGFGMYAKGGRGGKVFLVTTLEDYAKGEAPIPGSLRAAVEAKGPRIVVFRVGGTIQLKGPLQIYNPCLTIAGQTAPGGGICLKGYPLWIGQGQDIVIRYLRIRPGDLSRSEIDGVMLLGGKDIIIDHCSVSWSIDECLSTVGASSTTIQWTMISLPLNRSFHMKGEHGLGSIISGPGWISFHHNIYAHCANRNPRVAADVLLDFRNNVIYDWGSRAGYNADDPIRMNYVGNYLKPGPSTEDNVRGTAFHFSGPAKAYVAGNIIEGRQEADADNWRMMWYPGRRREQALRQAVGLDQPLPSFPVTTTSADVAYREVLEGCGAVLPQRDSLDAMIVEQIRNGTGGIIDSQDDVGGWPELPAGAPPPDSDADGMPDGWEQAHGLNPSDPGDAGLPSADASGYSNVEVCINSLVPPPPDGWAAPPEIDAAKVIAEAQQVLAEVHPIPEERAATIVQRTAELAGLLKPTTGPMAPAVAAHLPRTLSVSVSEGVAMGFVLIPAGDFIMGSPPDEPLRDEEEVQHQVTITRPFYLATTETTWGQYAAVTGERIPRDADAHCPAIVNWMEAGDFCLRLSQKLGRRVRLPTEAQWEYACRAGTTTPFSTGQTISTDQAAYDGKYVYGQGRPGPTPPDFLPVKSFPPNPWGLYDMHGNAWEWCYDSWSRRYSPEPAVDPMGPPEEDPATHKEYIEHMKVLRGGSWITRPEYLRSACRFRYVPKNPYGFRVVVEVE
jgi:formylglycine-generating enzyme required for sulfatase activity/pectate lyase